MVDNIFKKNIFEDLYKEARTAKAAKQTSGRSFSDSNSDKENRHNQERLHQQKPKNNKDKSCTIS